MPQSLCVIIHCLKLVLPATLIKTLPLIASPGHYFSAGSHHFNAVSIDVDKASCHKDTSWFKSKLNPEW
jgi:hypothetical protein